MDSRNDASQSASDCSLASDRCVRSAPNELSQAMNGCWVDYDALPYQMATPEYDRLDYKRIDGKLLWRLDEEAAVDFVNYWLRELVTEGNKTL